MISQRLFFLCTILKLKFACILFDSFYTDSETPLRALQLGEHLQVNAHIHTYIERKFLKEKNTIKITLSVFTKCIDGSHLLWKLLLLLGLCILCASCLRWARGLLCLGLPSGLAAVGQPKCSVGSLHGARVYGG